MNTREQHDRDRGRSWSTGANRGRAGVLALATGLLLWTAGPALAQATAASGTQPEAGSTPSLYLGLDSRLWVEGTSSVQDYTCEAGVVAATFRTNPVEDPLVLGSLEETVSQMTLQVPAPQMDCDNDTMNEHMWKALKAEDHEQIRFELADYRVTGQSGDTATLELPGELTLAGVTRPHTMTAQAVQQNDGSLRVLGTSRFEMTEFEMEPPSLMFGLMKVHPPVTVHFDLVVRSQETQTSD